MRLERLTVKGFTRYDEAATLDVSSLPEGLISVCGANGAGKSTILDSALAVLDLEMPSRAGALADYSTQRDSYIDAIYTVGDLRYRARVSVDGIKRASDAVLEQLDDNGKGTPLNDGKVSTFRDARAKVFPKKEVLLASAFAPQNRSGSFVTAKPAQRKDLFSELLGMKRFETLAETAKKCLAVVEQALVRLRIQRDGLLKETHDTIAADLAERANRVQVESGTAEFARLDLRSQLDALEQERQQLQADVLEHRAAVERRATVTDTLARLRAERAGCDVAVRAADEAHTAGEADAVKSERDAIVLADANEQKAVETHDAAVKTLNEKIAGNRTLEARAPEIRAAAAAKADLETSITELRQKETGIRELIAEAQSQIRDRAARLRDAERAEVELQAARRQAETLVSVPCGGAGSFASCRFLADAKIAEGKIPDLEGQAAHAASLRTGIQYWQADAEKHDRALKAVLQQIASAEKAKAGHEPLARYASELAATEARIQGYEAEKATAAATLADRRAEYQQARTRAQEARVATCARLLTIRTEAVARVDAQRVDLDRQLVSVGDELAVVGDLVDRLQPSIARMAVVEADLTAARDAFTQNESALAALIVVRESIDRDRAIFRQKKTDLQQIAKRLALVEQEAVIWQTFVQCFGRDGLPTLEIDAAGPTISNLVNDLLSACFGTRFTLEFVTQEPKADGKGFKESFELKVYDNADGGDARDIADLSGGERVIVEEALRAAIALYVNSRNVSPVRTVFRDETVGSLDEANSLRYVDMLRRMQQLGGIAHVIFVSHNPDVNAMADAQVHVADGRLSVKLPPYADAA